MSKITITEALAELKTIDKRIGKKQEFIAKYLFRQDIIKDPLERDGGSFKLVQQEMQSIDDLNQRKIDIRRAIQEANAKEVITVGKQTRSIADWLVWRREIANGRVQFLNTISAQIDQVRKQTMQKGLVTTNADSGKPGDLIVNMNENKLAQDIEAIQEVLGVLDGQLSLKNATIVLDL